MDNIEVCSAPGALKYRCRKCRQLLEVSASVIQEIKGCDLQCSTQTSMIFLDIDHCPDWITEEINHMHWGKGKLHCFKCSGRLGSFDFVKIKVCACGNHELPPLHLLTDRLDIIQTKVERLEEQKQPIACSLSSPYERVDKGPGILTDTVTGKAAELFKCSTAHSICSNCLICSNHANVEIGEITRTVADLVPLEKFNQTEDCDNKNNNNSSVQAKCDTCDSSSGRVLTRSCDRHTQRDTPSDIVNDQASSFDTHAKRIRKRNRRRLRRYARYLNNIPNPYMVLQEAGLVDDTNTQVTDAGTASNTDEDMADDDEIVVAEADIPDEWICCICMEMYHKPHMCQPCGHLFCGPCLRILAKTTRLKPIRCPLCRKVIEECHPDTELKCRIEDMFPHTVKEREARMKKIDMLKYAPLPRCSNPMPQSPFQERMLAIDLIIQAFRRSQYVGRLACLLMLYICHNTLFWISKHIVRFPYTRDQDGFNEFLWWTARIVLIAYILQTIQNHRWYRYLRKFRVGSLVFIFVFSETWIRFFVTLWVLFTLI